MALDNSYYSAVAVYQENHVYNHKQNSYAGSSLKVP